MHLNENICQHFQIYCKNVSFSICFSETLKRTFCHNVKFIKYDQGFESFLAPSWTFITEKVLLSC